MRSIVRILQKWPKNVCPLPGLVRVFDDPGHGALPCIHSPATHLSCDGEEMGPHGQQSPLVKHNRYITTNPSGFP